MDDSSAFRNVYGSHHIIVPYDHGFIIKKIYRHGVRSACEQFEIHKLAADFIHPLLRAPRIGILINAKSYSMEQLFVYQKVHPIFIYAYTQLKEALISYSDYMITCGYFPYGYSILFSGSQFIITDFSKYGSIQYDRVYFKHLRTFMSLSEAQTKFGVETSKNLVFLEESDETDDENSLVVEIRGEHSPTPKTPPVGDLNG
jgi:hypothetical protein